MVRPAEVWANPWQRRGLIALIVIVAVVHLILGWVPLLDASRTMSLALMEDMSEVVCSEDEALF